MSHHRFSTPEASQALGIPVHVITYWLGQIPYPAEQDAQGQWRLTPEAMGVLQAVKGLKERNASMEEIRKHVRALQEAMPARPVPGAVTFVAPEPKPAAGDDRAWGIPPEAPKPPAKPVSTAPAPAAPKPPAPPKQKAPAPPQAQSVVPAAPAPVEAPAASPPGDALASITVMAQRYAHAAHQIGRLEAENEHLKATLARAGREADDAKCRIAELEAAANKPKKSRWWAWLAMGALL